MLNVACNLKIVKKGLLPLEFIDYLFDLYLPIIGKDASFLYLFLSKKVKEETYDGVFGDLVNESKLDLQSFLLAKKTLESIGLISSYKSKSSDDLLIMVGDLMTPKNFFTNLMLKGLLAQKIGEKGLNDLLNKYKVEEKPKNYVDVSAGIKDSFVIDFDPKYIHIGEKTNLEGINKNNIKENFSDVKLLNYLKKNSQINPDSISEEELNFSHQLAVLYGLDEKTIGGLIIECFLFEEAIGNKLDKNKLKRLAKTWVRGYKVTNFKAEEKTELNSTSTVAQKIAYYEAILPIEFLREKQDGIEPSSADKNIIDSLAFEVRFSNGMINALLDFVLNHKAGELSKNYIMKIATTLIRKGCRNTLDVLNVLYKPKQSSNNKVEIKQASIEKAKNDENYEKVSENEEENNEEIDIGEFF